MTARPLARVFVVDDEMVIADKLTVILRMSGFSAQAFSSPGGALEAARVKCPDLLISDVAMPQSTGTEVGIQIRALCPGSKGSAFLRRRAVSKLAAGCSRTRPRFTLPAKPVHPKDLLRDIAKQDFTCALSV